ncbi:MAG: hypothetical protein CUN56_12675 [Phototrophicales bacterium]|nr:MAG: hypothetical protein CUN56_12675 [Phototrophicales bacterium]RMG74774.1 MAG: hypothetical protein D6711_08000 [Chloroflexota bacterium]
MRNFHITVASSAYQAMVGVFAVFTVIGLIMFGDILQGVIFGIGVVVIHWMNELLHNIGHYIASRRVGYPMRGIRFWGVLASSIYPKDEGALPPRVHIQRAAGGPIFSAFITLLYVVMFVITQAQGGVGMLLLFGILDGLLVFTVGALMPVHMLTRLPIETDGDTILRYLSRSS